MNLWISMNTQQKQGTTANSWWNRLCWMDWDADDTAVVKPLEAGDSSSLVTSGALGREPARDRGRRDRSRSRGRREAPPPHGYLPPGPLAQSLRRSLQELWFSSIRLGILVSKWQSCVPPSRAFRSFQSAKMRVWKNAYIIKKVDYSIFASWTHWGHNNHARRFPRHNFFSRLTTNEVRATSGLCPTPRLSIWPGAQWNSPASNFDFFGRLQVFEQAIQCHRDMDNLHLSQARCACMEVWRKRRTAYPCLGKKVQKQGDHAHFLSEVAA